MMVEAFLRNLGLNETEIKVYFYLMTHGEAIASIVAKRLDLKRTAVYATLESLEQKEMITSFVKNDVTHFDAVEPDDIVSLCEQKVNEMNRLAKKASALKGELSKLRQKGKMPTLEVRGKVKYYQGLEAVTDLIDETLERPEKEQLCFGLNTYHAQLAGDDWQDYTAKRVKKGMSVRSVQPDSPEAVEYQARDKKELRETRLVPYSKFPDGCEINIIGDMIAMFTTKGAEPMGMKMHNKYMAQAMRSLFELAWERSRFYHGETEGGEKEEPKKGKGFDPRTS